MKLLHTADWHLGKVLKGHPRLDEQRAVMAEIVEIAAQERVDAVLVAGDVFESAVPTPEAEDLAWATLLALRATGAEVLVVAGNHDPADRFDALAPVFAAAGITVVGRCRRPEDGGVVRVRARSGEEAVVGLLPFLSQRGVVRAEHLLRVDGAEAAQSYAQRLGLLIDALSAGFGAGTVNVLLAHATVLGGKLGGGERDAQTVFEYWVPGTSFPATASYVALGHLHRTQELPAPSPLWYPGSPLAVDFGEEADAKHVLLVDAAPGRPSRVGQVPLASPRALRSVKGTVAELAALEASLGDALLRVTVTEPARAGLADEVRAALPNALEVRVEHQAAAVEAPTERRAGSPQELFGRFLEQQGVADERLTTLFADLLDAELAGGR